MKKDGQKQYDIETLKNTLYMLTSLLESPKLLKNKEITEIKCRIAEIELEISLLESQNQEFNF